MSEVEVILELAARKLKVREDMWKARYRNRMNDGMDRHAARAWERVIAYSDARHIIETIIDSTGDTDGQEGNDRSTQPRRGAVQASEEATEGG